MRLRLIYPRSPDTVESMYSHSWLIDKYLTLYDNGRGLYEPGKRSFLIPPYNLMLLAALVPPDVDVDIIDERTQAIPFDESVDLVGITCMTADAPRAYEIAQAFRSRGVPVILGGIHPTVMTAEALQYADAVVIGEAEGVFKQAIEDAKVGRLARTYSSTKFHDMRGLPVARRDLLDAKFYLTKNLVQTTRGCPHQCSFCSISRTAGSGYRCRPVDEVVDELSCLNGSFVSFVDDNINGNMQYAKKLFEAIQPLNLNWFGDATLLLAEKEPLLRLAAASGCKILLYGFESLSQTTLNSINKKFNKVSHFKSLIQRTHDYGIGVIGTFILGLDGDTAEEFDALVQFANEAALDLVQIAVMTPYPGTALFEEMKSTGRLTTTDWRDYDTTTGAVVFKPLTMSPAELQEGFFRVYEEIYQYVSIARRLYRSGNFPMFFLPYNLRQRSKVSDARNLHRKAGR